MRLWVYVDDNGQSLSGGLRNDTVELRDEIVPGRAVASPGDEWVGVDAETNVVEPELVDEGEVVRSDERTQAAGGVIRRVLGEPVAGVDTAAKVLRPCEGKAVWCGRLPRLG